MAEGKRQAQGAERTRLEQAARGEADWRRFGPWLADRQWGTVREDYSANGDAWGSFPHEHARSRAYRWGEDGLLFNEYFHGDTGRGCGASHQTGWTGLAAMLAHVLARGGRRG